MSKEFEKIKEMFKQYLIFKIQIMTYHPIFCWAG